MFRIKTYLKIKFCYKGNTFYIKMYLLFLHNTRTPLIEKWMVHAIAVWVFSTLPQMICWRGEILGSMSWKCGAAELERTSDISKMFLPCSLCCSGRKVLLGIDYKHSCCTAALLSAVPLHAFSENKDIFSRCLQPAVWAGKGMHPTSVLEHLEGVFFLV